MRFEDWGENSPVHVLYDVPSRLPTMLETRVAQAILVSSVDAFLVPNRRMAANLCIGSHGPVKSVRLFSKVAPAKICSLALDASSMTSNRLAQIILAERYGSHPSVVSHPPNLAQMLQIADACVLIGDIGMAADGAGLHVLDLGEEWQFLTEKPFVWAAWIGDEGLTPAVAGWLEVGAALGYVGREVSPDPLVQPFDGGEPRDAVLERLIDRAMRHAHWDAEVVKDYYTNVMVYVMNDFMLAGLHEFQSRLLHHGFEDCEHFPEIIHGKPPSDA
jgi:chorismate dehydratase